MIPAKEKLCEIQSTNGNCIELIRTVLKAIVFLITSWAIVSLAGGGLAKVEEVKHRQGEKEENRPSHLQQADPQQANLARTVFVDLVNR